MAAMKKIPETPAKKINQLIARRAFGEFKKFLNENKDDVKVHRALDALGAEACYNLIGEMCSFDDTSLLEDAVIRTGTHIQIMDMAEYGSTNFTKAFKSVPASAPWKKAVVFRDDQDKQEFLEYVKTIPSTEWIENFIARNFTYKQCAEFILANDSVDVERFLRNHSHRTTILEDVKKKHKELLSAYVEQNNTEAFRKYVTKYGVNETVKEFSVNVLKDSSYAKREGAQFLCNQFEISIFQEFICESKNNKLIEYYLDSSEFNFIKLYKAHSDPESISHTKWAPNNYDSWKNDFLTFLAEEKQTPVLSKTLCAQFEDEEIVDFLLSNPSFTMEKLKTITSSARASGIESLLNEKKTAAVPKESTIAKPISMKVATIEDILATNDFETIKSFVVESRINFIQECVHRWLTSNATPLQLVNFFEGVQQQLLQPQALASTFEQHILNETENSNFELPAHKKWVANKYSSRKALANLFHKTSYNFIGEYLSTNHPNRINCQKLGKEFVVEFLDSTSLQYRVLWNYVFETYNTQTILWVIKNLAKPKFDILKSVLSESKHKDDTELISAIDSYKEELILKLSTVSQDTIHRVLEPIESVSFNKVTEPFTPSPISETISTESSSFTMPSTTASTKPLDQFLSTLKNDAKAGGYAAGANLATELVRSMMLSLLEDHTEDSKVIANAEKFLESQIGIAFIHAAIGYFLTYGVKLTNPHQIAMAEKFRQKGSETLFTELGMQIFTYAAPFVSQITGLLPDENGDISAANVLSAANALKQAKSKGKKFRIGEEEKVEEAEAKPAKKRTTRKIGVRVKPEKKKSNVVSIREEDDLPEAAEETKISKRVASLLSGKNKTV